MAACSPSGFDGQDCFTTPPNLDLARSSDPVPAGPSIAEIADAPKSSLTHQPNQIVHAVLAGDLDQVKVRLRSATAVKMMEVLYEPLRSLNEWESDLAQNELERGCLYAIACVIDREWEGSQDEKDAFLPLKKGLERTETQTAGSQSIIQRAIRHLSDDHYST